MRLFDLPDELLLMIAKELETERDTSIDAIWKSSESERNINAFVLTSRRLHRLLNINLYRYNIRWFGSMALGWAARKGQVAAAQRLIDLGADCQAASVSGQTPLLQAASRGHEEIVKLLLATGRAGPTVKPNGMFPRIPLCQAARGGHAAVVKLLLAVDGIDPDVDDWLGTPLHQAAQGGYAGVVELLLATGKVDPQSTRRGTRQTPLWHAAKSGFDEVIKLLLATDGVDPDLTGYVEEDGITEGTPLYVAAGHGHDTVVRLLLATGKVDVNFEYRDGSTPLFYAVSGGYSNIAQLLLEKGARVNDVNVHGETALLRAAMYGRVEIARLLLDYGATTEEKKRGGVTALHTAARKGYGEVVRLLLQKRAVIETRDVFSETPLQDAARQNLSDVVRLLLEHGADADAAGEFDFTALHQAATNESVDIVQLLLGHGASIDARDSDRMTPLHIASKNGKLGTVQLLLELGADIDAEDINGWTALENASTAGSSEPVCELLSRGAQLRSAKTYRMLLQMAAYHGSWDVIQRLEEKRGGVITDDDNDKFAEALQVACLEGHTGLVQRLLWPDVDPRKADEHGWTILYSARMSRGRIDVKDIPPQEKYLESSGEHLPFPPTCWSVTDKSSHLRLEDGDTRVIYIGPGEGKDAKPGSVRANHPIPLHNDGQFYFEVEILSGDNPLIAIGLCRGYTPINTLPGWEYSSWGYHSDDGWNSVSDRYGPTFGAGDVVGCYFHAEHGIFFYKNREPIRKCPATITYFANNRQQSLMIAATGGTCRSVLEAVESHTVYGKLYPVVGMSSYGLSAEVNFGHKPFRAPWIPSDTFRIKELLFAE